eukprot:2194065-Amphidinium_carterae.1
MTGCLYQWHWNNRSHKRHSRTQESLTSWFREIVSLAPGIPEANLASVPDDVMFQELLRVRQSLE